MEGEFMLAQGLRVQFVMIGKGWWGRGRQQALLCLQSGSKERWIRFFIHFLHRLMLAAFGQGLSSLTCPDNSKSFPIDNQEKSTPAAYITELWESDTRAHRTVARVLCGIWQWPRKSIGNHEMIASGSNLRWPLLIVGSHPTFLTSTPCSWCSSLLARKLSR